MSISVVLVNTSGPEEAEAIGRNLVDSRLAAAANVIGGIVSIYRWQGAVQRRQEAQLIVKTQTNLAGAVIARVGELHSYECPGIVVLPVADGNPDYFDWVGRETTSA